MQRPIHTILCATDFSRHGVEIVRFSAELAQALGSKLQVFHAVCHGRPPGSAPTRIPAEPQRTRQIEQIRTRIRSILTDRPTPWEAVVRFGDPVAEVAAVAGSDTVDLVVAASYGLPGWKRLLLGTVVESMAAVLDIPLWVAPSQHARPALPKEILVACELTVDDPPIQELAVGLAEAFQSRLHWVNVAESPVYPGMIEPDAGPYGEMQQKLQDRLQQQLVERQPAALRRQGRSQTAVLTGNAGEALISYARRQSIDLIVAGVHRRASSGKFQLSSTSLTLLRRAPCAVLTVPLGAGDEHGFRRRRYGRKKMENQP